MSMSTPPPLPPPPSSSHHHPQQPEDQKGSAAAAFTTMETSTPNASSVPSPNSSLNFNKERIRLVANRLAVHFHAGSHMDPSELFSFLFALARCIDYAVSHNDVPPNADDLPSIIKKAYQQRYEGFLQAALLVLLTSLKNACNKKWFTTANSEELLKMADEISSGFCIGANITSESINCLQVVRQILPRYFPHIKLSRLLASFEVKAGYDILMADIYIPRNIAFEERIRLFVAQSENIASSGCIISPPQVSFLINGRGVEKRTNVSMDTGPQFPTDITKMLKFGLNIFQAVGSFHGNYSIVIALMKETKPSPDAPPVLQDYVHPVAATIMPDTEVIEDSFRISLNCPLSFKRIETPVKGHLCKHHQCFDFKNFMNMNQRNPSWRCPHCNQSVSYIDIRIDQNMAKILNEAGKAVSDVIISADGTWKVVEGHKSNSGQLLDRPLTTNQHEDTNSKSEPTGSADDSTTIMDLTAEVDCVEILTNQGCLLQEGSNACETTDRKPFQDKENFQVSQSIHVPVQINPSGIPSNPSLPMRATSVATQTGGVYLPTFKPNTIRNEPHRTLIPTTNITTTRSLETVQGSPVPAQQSQFNSKRPRLGEGLHSLISPPPSVVQQSRTSNAANNIFERSPYLRTSGIPTPLQQNHSAVTTMQQNSNLGSRSTATSDTTVRPPSSGRNGLIHPHLDIEISRREHLNSSSYPRSHQTSIITSTIIPRSPIIPPRVQQTSQMSTTACACQNSKIHHQPQHGSQMANVQLGSAPLKASMTATPPQMTVNRVRPSSNIERIHYIKMPPLKASMTATPPQMTVNRVRPSSNTEHIHYIKVPQPPPIGSQEQPTITNTRSDILSDLTPESRNWKATGRMRGSLSGGAFNEALSRYQTQTVVSGSSTQTASTTSHDPAPAVAPTKEPKP